MSKSEILAALEEFRRSISASIDQLMVKLHNPSYGFPLHASPSPSMSPLPQDLSINGQSTLPPPPPRSEHPFNPDSLLSVHVTYPPPSSMFQPPLPQTTPPTIPPESSEEDEATSDDFASQESDSKTVQMQMPAKPNQAPPPQPKEQSSSSGKEDSISETDSEPDEPTSKPLASKPVAEKQKANGGASNARSKPNAPDPVTPTKSAAAKRSAGDASSKDAKKLKADEPETSEKKSNLFQRLWSEEDEIAVLEGMIEYTSKKKADPVSDLSAFHDFIKEKLHIDATRTQLQDKIRRLKKKYENNKSKEKEGEDKIFSKPHEHKSYDLSKRIWGNQSIKEIGGAKVVGSPKANGRVAKKTDGKKVNAAEREEAKDVKNAIVVEEETLPAAKRLKSNSVGASVEVRMLIAGQGLEGDEEWEKLKEEELELYLKQLEVKVAQTKLVLDAMKGRGH